MLSFSLDLYLKLKELNKRHYYTLMENITDEENVYCWKMN